MTRCRWPLERRQSSEFATPQSRFVDSCRISLRRTRQTVSSLRLLVDSGEKGAAADMLRQIAADRQTSRTDRWQAAWQLHELDATAPLPDLEFDRMSQYYLGLLTERSDERSAEKHFIQSLVDANDPSDAASDELIKIFAATGRQYAALKLAAAGDRERPDDLTETLSKAAEEIGDYAKAISYERARSDGGDPRRIAKLQHLVDESKTRAVDLTVDLKNTREL